MSQNNKHLAFGFGPHLCIGRHLATLEMKVLFEILLEQLDFDNMIPQSPVENLSTNLLAA